MTKIDEELKKKEESASKQELDELKQIFDQFDKDGNGKLDRDELTQLMKTVNSDVTQQEVDQMIQHADCDNDGTISFEEFKLQML